MERGAGEGKEEKEGERREERDIDFLKMSNQPFMCYGHPSISVSKKKCTLK